MTDLEVDYDRLERGQQVAAQLKQEFDDIEDNVPSSLSVWSHEDVRSAMNEFAGNMDYNRKKLSEKLEDTRSKIETTLTTFRDTDEDLAKSLRSKGKK